MNVREVPPNFCSKHLMQREPKVRSEHVQEVNTCRKMQHNRLLRAWYCKQDKKMCTHELSVPM